MIKLAPFCVVTAMLLAAGCAAAGRGAVQDSARAELKRSMVSLEGYVGKREGRWLTAEETRAFFRDWRGRMKIHEEWGPGNSHIAALDVDRDGLDEIVLLARWGEHGYFAVYRPTGGGVEKLIDEWGYGVAYPYVTDFDGNGTIDFAWQGGRGWTMRLARTTRKGIAMIATGSGGLATDIGPGLLNWGVGCGWSYGRYGGCEGCGSIERTVPYRFKWDPRQQDFVLVRKEDAGEPRCVLAWCLNQHAGLIGERYIDCWNWAVCLLCARLEYDKAAELAGIIPESPQGEIGKTMPSKDKAALIARIGELGRRYRPGFRLSAEPVHRSTTPWFPK
jgi:hypothetical protein